MKQKLVILTTSFGTNFSGGAKATCEVFSRIQNEFESITVLATEIGNHQFQKLNFIKVSNWVNTYLTVRKLKDDFTIFYGDFYNSFLLGIARVPFMFTYHDNWPELSKLNMKSYVQNIFFSKVYNYIFTKAKTLITVSNFKKEHLEKYAKKVHLIPNGFDRSPPSSKKEGTQTLGQVVMVGNIDERKYALAIKLFDYIQEQDKISIDIYGHTVNKGIAKKLSNYSFISLKGFVNEVPYSSYKLLLHTSFSESFGLIFCEAIYQELPVLTFNTGGALEIISPENGKIIEAYKLKDMYHELKNMIHSPIQAKAETVTSFSWERTSLNYQKLF